MHLSSRKKIFLKGAFVLTLVGLISRVIGFFFRIFLSRSFGTEGIGIYHLIFPAYALCISLSAAGIETALSRLTARYASLGRPDLSRASFQTALFLSTVLSLLCMVCIQIFAQDIAVFLLNDSRCEPLLKVMSYALPFASVHSCICGYSLGLKQTKIPGISQLVEQCARVLGVYLLYTAAKQPTLRLLWQTLTEALQTYFQAVEETGSAGIILAVCGLVLGEIAGAFYSIFAVRRILYTKSTLSRRTISLYLECLRDILKHAVPVTANRISLNLLQSVEVVSIPRSLMPYGFTRSSALSHYGILNGIAMPCILFPSAITNSISMMMLPTVAEIQAASQNRTLRQLIRKVSGSCLVLGFLCTLGFLVFADFLGAAVFHSPEAASYIRVLAFICPFLYTNSTYISILNGLGHTNMAFLINFTGLCIRIAGVFLLIPQTGMSGYLTGLLASQIFVFAAAVRVLVRTI